ncbi:Flp family type IVb pilin [Paenarthrobacter ureafaciens]|jgi:pilus assembly protein Flp/PilA|nr:Flp family type IVb pilin [Paenarthrobacter ureafaciens]NKR10045.1 pilus assembly protein [Arthrobacter sp. M5]NKR14652.1 pilus assembly protein [Arthrobacter sp. M6]OEH60202.1 pilus assembly protein [Arthrobacter sp. D4]OEH60817.1 pilus assembly protein [Arthrobacter sp. D2]
MLSVTSFIAGVKTRLTKEEKGATMVEYGLMVSLIAIVVVAGLLILGPAINQLFLDVAAAL